MYLFSAKKVKEELEKMHMSKDVCKCDAAKEKQGYSNECVPAGVAVVNKLKVLRLFSLYCSVFVTSDFYLAKFAFLQK